jgi:hypothetical protein
MKGPASNPPKPEPSEPPDEITLRGLGEIELPSRDENRGNSFADWNEEYFEPLDSVPPCLISDPPEPCK